MRGFAEQVVGTFIGAIAAYVVVAVILRVFGIV